MVFFRRKGFSIILCSGFKSEAMNIEKLNRTRIHLILFSLLSVSFSRRIGGGRNPFRAMKLLNADCLADLFCGSGGLVLCL